MSSPDPITGITAANPGNVVKVLNRKNATAIRDIPIREIEFENTNPNLFRRREVSMRAIKIPTENSHALVGILKKATRVGRGISLFPKENITLNRNDIELSTMTDPRTNFVNSAETLRDTR